MLIEGLHERGIKILLDLAVNHTSDEHEWFKDSRSSRSSSRRDCYFWRDPKLAADGNRKPPNNWASILGGSAWTWDEGSGQYYLSFFLPSQPDLNWTNAEMRRATYADMAFWLDKGVDGYRIDSMNLMSKHPDLPDAPITKPSSQFQTGAKYFASGPRIHEYIKEMQTEVFNKYDCMTVGELGFINDENEVSDYVAKDRRELNIVFAGDIVNMDFGPDGKYGRDDFRLEKLREITKRWQDVTPKFNGWNTIYMDNHDSGRSLTRYASDLPEHRTTAAMMLATYLGTLGRKLFLLQGQEIEMANVPREWGFDDYVDVEGKNAYHEILKQRGEGADMSDLMRELRLKARDNGRLPMQWDASRNAGFTKSEKPWMKINPDFKEWNVDTQIYDKQSVMSYWKEMLGLRKKEADIFVYGKFDMVSIQRSGEDVFAYTMSSLIDDKKALVLLNFSVKENNFVGKGFESWRKLLGANPVERISSKAVDLNAYEGVIFCNW